MNSIRLLPLFLIFVLALLTGFYASDVQGQAGSITLSGEVLDPNGAVVPGAAVMLTQGSTVLSAASGADGRFQIRLTAGTWQLTANAAGFATLSMPNLALTASRQLNLPLKITEQQQQVNVTSDTNGVGISNDQNINSTVIKGADLDALSDDPDELQRELLALAGPSAGPDGGQIYIDGFTGGQLPPKSSILEVRVNQNPFSAENDRIGYGRIDILTKPGAQRFGGQARFSIVSSALDTSNPLVSVQPSYQYYSLGGNVTGPLAKNAAYFLGGNYWQRQNQAIVRAVNPAGFGIISQAFPAPYSTGQGNARIDLQLGKHVMSLQYGIFRTQQNSVGVGGLALPSQGVSGYDLYNMLQLQDTIIVNDHFLDQVAVRWIHDRSNRVPVSFAPSVSVSGAFTTGGSAQGAADDHLDAIEVHNYATLTLGYHVMRMGVLLRSYRDANYSQAGINGSYSFQSLAQYQAGTPALYTATIINNPTVRILTFDGAVFFQDEWRWRPNVSIGYGLRLEGQNRIHNPLDVEPRAALTWAPHNDGKTPPLTSLHVGAGVFDTRFNYSQQEQTIRNNGVVQVNYTVDNPAFYNPNTPASPGVLMSAGSSHPDIRTLDPHFHAQRYLQAGGGVDQVLGKQSTLNLSYLYTQGTHMYLTNNITAPIFNPANYTISGSSPTTLNYQFQAGGIFRQHQIIVTTRTKVKRLSLQMTYTYSRADGTSAVPSDAQNPGFDYGRASFDIHHKVSAIGTWSLLYGVNLNTVLIAQSGTPFNITTGSDLTGNNQFNARPTYGACGAGGVYSTPFGCLDDNPTGKGEQIVPIDVGTGPANMVMNTTLSKVFGIGPRRKAPAVNAPAAAVTAAQNAGPVRPGQISVSAPQAPQAPRRFQLSMVLGATNVFNIVNLAAPNGVLNSPLFNQAQSVAGGPYTPSSPGNRTVYLNTNFNF